MQPFIWSGFQVSPRYTYQLELRRSEDDLFAGMDKGTRNLIRRAEKDELSAQVANVSARQFELVSETFKRKGIKVDHQILERMMTQKEASELGFAVEVRQGNDV